MFKPKSCETNLATLNYIISGLILFNSFTWFTRTIDWYILYCGIIMAITNYNHLAIYFIYIYCMRCKIDVLQYNWMCLQLLFKWLPLCCAETKNGLPKFAIAFFISNILLKFKNLCRNISDKFKLCYGDWYFKNLFCFFPYNGVL